MKAQAVLITYLKYKLIHFQSKVSAKYSTQHFMCKMHCHKDNKQLWLIIVGSTIWLEPTLMCKNKLSLILSLLWNFSFTLFLLTQLRENTFLLIFALIHYSLPVWYCLTHKIMSLVIFTQLIQGYKINTHPGSVLGIRRYPIKHGQKSGVGASLEEMCHANWSMF